LIAYGGLLLYSNFHPELSLMRLFAFYWPWLLVAWGMLRMVEIIVAHLRWRPIPPPLRAGAFLCVVVLCVAGSVAHAIEQHDFPSFRWRGSQKVHLSAAPLF